LQLLASPPTPNPPHPHPHPTPPPTKTLTPLQGALRAMTPTLVIPRPGGGRHTLTPPPANVLSAEVVETLRYHAIEVADYIGLRCVVGSGFDVVWLVSWWSI